MGPISELNQELIDGEYAEDAINAFDIEWLLDMKNGPAEYALRRMRRERADYCLALARNLGLKGEPERVMLRNLQDVISVTPPDQRCPCQNIVDLESQSH